MAGKLEGIHGASVHSGSWGGEERGGAVPLILFSASLERQVETLGTNMGHELSRGRPASPASPAHISKAKPTGNFSVQSPPSLRWEEGCHAGAFWESWVPSPP